MQVHDATLARPTAAWISRYAAGLIASTPSMHPLDAVRQAMEEASGGPADEGRKRQQWQGVLHPGAPRR